MTKVTCPKCNESFGVAAQAIIPEKQTLYVKLESESELFSAESIGKVIINMEKIQRGVAKNMGANVSVFIQSIDVKPHQITIGFQIIQTAE